MSVSENPYQEVKDLFDKIVKEAYEAGYNEGFNTGTQAEPEDCHDPSYIKQRDKDWETYEQVHLGKPSKHEWNDE